MFDTLRDRLPVLRDLAQNGLWGPLLSSMPPITVPAWACMVTGQDPGQLGLYGFRDRAGFTYDQRRLASSLAFDPPPVWSLLSRAGLRCRVLGVPLTYPPKPVRGCLVSGPLTPSADSTFTYPPELGEELEAAHGPLIFDVDRHAAPNETALFEQIQEMTAQRFAIANAWAAQPDWDFFMMADMGPDRLHHAFWHRPSLIERYYVELDRRLGELLERLPAGTEVVVISDHGAQTMEGGFAINQWLMEQGYLTLHGPPGAPGPLLPGSIDWSRTRVWADGGYVARIYFNVAGREPEGIVPPGSTAALGDELEAELGGLAGPQGEPVTARLLRPARIYDALNGTPPDLILELDDLRLRALGSVGLPATFARDNDRGPDQANHAQHGLIIWRDGGGGRRREDLSLYDVAPSVLAHFGLDRPKQMRGRVLGAGPTGTDSPSG